MHPILYFGVIILSNVVLWASFATWTLRRGMFPSLGGHGLGELALFLGAAAFGLLTGVMVAFSVKRTRPPYLFWSDLFLLIGSGLYLWWNLN